MPDSIFTVSEAITHDEVQLNGSHDVKQQHLLDILHQAASKSDDGIRFTRLLPSLGTDGQRFAEQTLSYKQLEKNACNNAINLRALSSQFRAGSPVLIHLDNQFDNIEMFWTVAVAGGIPTMSTPLSADFNQRLHHLRHLKKLLSNPVCVTSRRIMEKFPEFGQEFNVCTAESIRERVNGIDQDEIYHQTTQLLSFSRNAEIPIAALMLTSGSTGDAKAVPLTVPQMLVSIKGKIDRLASTQESIFLNWIGLDHVANLTEIHLQAMLLDGAKQIQAEASDVLMEPLSFLQLVARHRVSHTFAPNFFLSILEKDLVASRPSDDIKSADLSCLVSIVSGGEANSVKTGIDLAEQLRLFKASGPLINVAYGLTEACAALTYGFLSPENEAEEEREFASIGKPIKGAGVRICLADGEIVTEPYKSGSLELGGANVFKGYFNNAEATNSSFTSDGWFKTGDLGYYDRRGYINLAGRAKEVLNINGVKFSPQDVENVLDQSNLNGAMASYYAVFAHRAKNKSTEGYCVIYASKPVDQNTKLDTVEQIARLASGLVSVRPHWIIPLPQELLEKSSLGKLSRTKLQKRFASGLYNDYKIQADFPVNLANGNFIRKPPRTAAERKIVETLREMLGVPEELLSTDQTIFDLGITSITMFHFERLLRRKFEASKQQGISIITFLSNPGIAAIGSAIEQGQSSGDAGYCPYSVIQSKGSKTPLWLVHPASGNSLAFLPLSRRMTDRPLYALTSKGLRPGESYFSTFDEMASTYYKYIKQVQPSGPYAIVGYSLGASIGYELAQRLDATGDEVAMFATLDAPPHLTPLITHLDWTDSTVSMAYFLELIAQERITSLTEECRKLDSKQDIIVACLDAAFPDKRSALNLGPEQLLAIAEVTSNFKQIAGNYEPTGKLPVIDAFYCEPLQRVQMSREKWVRDYICEWQNHSAAKIGLYECEGEHADMLNAKHIAGFEKVFVEVLEARGI